MLVVMMTLFVWTLARPALASAPLCDPRGATVFAPAPQLQQPLTSIDVEANECTRPTLDPRSVDHGGAPAGRIAPQVSDALLVQAPVPAFVAPFQWGTRRPRAMIEKHPARLAAIERPPRT